MYGRARFNLCVAGFYLMSLLRSPSRHKAPPKRSTFWRKRGPQSFTFCETGHTVLMRPKILLLPGGMRCRRGVARSFFRVANFRRQP
jgi:hypothetical protein